LFLLAFLEVKLELRRGEMLSDGFDFSNSDHLLGYRLSGKGLETSSLESTWN
jgi:hypothetical protein